MDGFNAVVVKGLRIISGTQVEDIPLVRGIRVGRHGDSVFAVVSERHAYKLGSVMRYRDIASLVRNVNSKKV